MGGSLGVHAGQDQLEEWLLPLEPSLGRNRSTEERRERESLRRMGPQLSESAYNTCEGGDLPVTSGQLTV